MLIFIMLGEKRTGLFPDPYLFDFQFSNCSIGCSLHSFQSGLQFPFLPLRHCSNVHHLKNKTKKPTYINTFALAYFLETVGFLSR